jgi:hypothetical protein
VTRAIANEWCWMKETATKSRRRDLQMPVSSLVFGAGQGSIASLLLPLDLSCWHGTRWIRVTSKMTISARGAFSTGRMPVGRGR